MCEWFDGRTTLLINGLGMTVFSLAIYLTRSLADLRIVPAEADRNEVH